MQLTRMVLVVRVALFVTSGCSRATGYLTRVQAHVAMRPDLSSTVAFGLWHRCPARGTEGTALKIILGVPRQVEQATVGDTDLAVWTFDLEGGLILRITLRDGLVDDWKAQVPDGWRPKTGLQGSRANADLVARYLAVHSATGSVVYAMRHGCPRIGMTRDQVAAALVRPTDRPHAGDEPGTNVWRIVLGFEGQHLSIQFGADSVVSWYYGDPRLRRIP